MLHHPDSSTVIRGATRLVAGAPGLVASTPRWSQVHLTFSLALLGVPKHLTFTPRVHHVPGLSDPDHSKGQQECPLRV
jgi:hypothetical protein